VEALKKWENQHKEMFKGRGQMQGKREGGSGVPRTEIFRQVKSEIKKKAGR